MRIRNESDNPIFYATEYSAGFDIPANEDVLLMPGEFKAVATGLFLAFDKGIDGAFELQIRPRSGLALKHGITVLNAPGTIDCDYTDEIKIILINHSKTPYIINKGDRIAQGVMGYLIQSDNITIKTVKRSGGFGHSGQ